jgi:hypothetical protein
MDDGSQIRHAAVLAVRIGTWLQTKRLPVQIRPPRPQKGRLQTSYGMLLTLRLSRCPILGARWEGAAVSAVARAPVSSFPSRATAEPSASRARCRSESSHRACSAAFQSPVPVILLACCPVLGAEWEQRRSGSCGQTRSLWPRSGP